MGNAAGRILEVAAPPGDGWPDANAAPLVAALVEGEADALALARLRLPGVLVRAAGGTAGVRRGAALVADLPAATAAALVSDGDRPGRAAVADLHADLHDASAGLALPWLTADRQPAGSWQAPRRHGYSPGPGIYR